MTPAVTIADFAPPAHPCPDCGAECKRHSTDRRRVKDVSLDGPVVIEARVGKYRCTACDKMFRAQLPFAPARKRYTARAVRKATVAVQEDKTTYTALPRRLERDFSIRPAKSTGWAWFQEFAEGIDVDEYLRWACSRFSGQLSVDSVVDGDKEMWFATDPLNRDLILGYHRCDSANGESLTAFLTTLRDQYGVRPLLFIGDDAAVFDSVPEQVWPGARLGLCHFHAIKRLSYDYLRKSLRERANGVKPAKPERQPKPTTKAGREEARQEREAYKAAKERWVELHRRRRLFLKSLRSLRKTKSAEAHEAEYITAACAEFPTLAVFREFVLDFYAIFDAKAGALMDFLRRAFLRRWAAQAEQDEYLRYVLTKFTDERWFGKLTAYTAFDNAQRTTNSTERANRWFRKRQKTHYRNRKEHTITRMLHADLIYRRERTDPSEPPAELRVKRAPLAESA